MKREDQNQYMYRLAERNDAENKAKLCEPRALWDTFVFDGSTQRVYGTSGDSFRNGERFPYRITHLLMAMLYEADDGQSPVGGDERMVQRYGLRIKAHGTYYQNSEFTPLPLFSNVPVAASDVATQAQATWRFAHPFTMGNRDTLSVRVRLLVGPAANNSERVTVSFQGVGRLSRQPKILTGSLSITDTDEHAIDVDSFRNDGTEPFDIHEMIVHHTPVDAADPVGVVKNVRVRAKANGNGTNQEWIVGPKSGTYDDQFIPAPLLGNKATRAIVHELPGDGWLWYPGEGVRAEMRSYETTRAETVLLAALGHVIVL